MKPEKMTDDEIARLVQMFTKSPESRFCSPETTLRLLAHIAALTAERDDMRAEAHAAVSALLALAEALTDDKKEPALDAARRVVRERDVLRERVQALETALQQAVNQVAAHELGDGPTRVQELEARLSTIRQRIDKDALAKWLTRWASCTVEKVAEELNVYLLDEDAPETCAEPSTVEGAHKLDTNPEPTTAEAFATVREELMALGHTDDGATLPLVSLLERRMGR